MADNEKLIDSFHVMWFQGFIYAYILYWKLDVIFTWVDEIRVGICDFTNDVSSASIISLPLNLVKDEVAVLLWLEMYEIKDDVNSFLLAIFVFLCF